MVVKVLSFCFCKLICESLMGDLLLTLIIKNRKEIDTQLFSEEMVDFLDVLSMLCSFYSSSDFASFIFSEKFLNLANIDRKIIFEIGIYFEDEKTLQLTTDGENIVLTDLINQNVFSGNCVVCQNSEYFEVKINDWLATVLNG